MKKIAANKNYRLMKKAQYVQMQNWTGGPVDAGNMRWPGPSDFIFQNLLDVADAAGKEFKWIDPVAVQGDAKTGSGKAMTFKYLEEKWTMTLTKG